MQILLVILRDFPYTSTLLVWYIYIYMTPVYWNFQPPISWGAIGYNRLNFETQPTFVW